jgi:peptidylprolyl isomerase
MAVPRGLKIADVLAGSGRLAERKTVVLVHYDCYLPRGELWETSRTHRWPVQFRVGERTVVPALEYGVRGMRAGGKRSVKAPPQLTYYERKREKSPPPNATLRYEIELLRVSDEWDNAIYSLDYSGGRCS